VIGATGHVGKELIPQLLGAGQPVRVFTRDERKVAHFDKRVERAVGDLDNPETLAPAMCGVDQVFLVTGSVQHDINALAAARRAGVQHVVKLSTIEAGPGPGHPTLQVGQWHREREQIIEASGIAWTFLRPSMFMSNLMEWWAESIKHAGAVYFPGGKGKVAPVDPLDIASVATVALTQPGHTGHAYELTGPELLTIGEMVQIIAHVLGRPLKYVNIPPLVAKLFMLKSGMDKVLVGALMEMMTAMRKNQGAILTDTVERVTGHPARKLETWCREHVAHFQAHAVSDH
jgi:uncharacterized protein YbjT (DUF2867 family)